jgi:hypothetical protein
MVVVDVVVDDLKASQCDDMCDERPKKEARRLDL